MLHLRHTHSKVLLLPYLCHSSFHNPSVASATSHLILQPFLRFNCVTAHSPTLPSLHLRHSSFSNPSFDSPTSQLILQPFLRFFYVTAHSKSFRRFTYVTAHSTTLPLLDLRHSSFNNPSIALPTSQFILQPCLCFTYVTTHSPTLLSLLLCNRLFTYVT